MLIFDKEESSLENDYNDFMNELSIQTKMENVWLNTCGTWENCNQENIQSFLAQCLRL